MGTRWQKKLSLICNAIIGLGLNQTRHHPFKVPLEDKFSDNNYLRQTWTGRLVVINAIMFAMITLSARSIFGALMHPDTQTLVRFGAKEGVAIAHGEWWRLVTPIFLHIGIIHFLLNNAALRIIGRIIENHLGSRWFLLVYLLSGIIGNVCSSFSNTAIGAGASGSIFGLIGVGVVAEWIHELKLRQSRANRVVIDGDIIELASDQESPSKLRLVPGPFTFMALLNIGLAVSLNFIFSLSDSVGIGIDNAAHLGGLAAGISLGLASQLSRPKSMLTQSKALSYGIVAASICVCIGMCAALIKTDVIQTQYIADASGQKPPVRYWRYTRWLEYDPMHPRFRFLRGELLIKNREYEAALKDFELPSALPDYKEAFGRLILELDQEGNTKGSALLQTLLEAHSPQRL